MVGLRAEEPGLRAWGWELKKRAEEDGLKKMGNSVLNPKSSTRLLQPLPLAMVSSHWAGRSGAAATSG